jgi:hypothetical protein
MKAVMLIVLTAMLVVVLSGATYAKGGGLVIASEVGNYITKQDNLANFHSNTTTSNEYNEKHECMRHVEQSCQTFGVLNDKFSYSNNRIYSNSDGHHSPLKAQMSFLEFIKPPRP